MSVTPSRGQLVSIKGNTSLILVMSRIPVELIDAVFEHLKDDKPALIACCLVCKAWVHSSRRLLFDSLILRYRNSGFPPRPTTTGTWPLAISPYIRRLFLVEELPPIAWNDLLPRIRTLQNLRSFTVTSLPHEILHHPSLITSFDTITRLHLSVGRFASFAHLAQIVCIFRHLDTLILSHAQWPRSGPPSAILSPSHTLRALELLDCDWVAFLQWLMSCDHAPTLHSLCVRGSFRYGGNAALLSQILKALGSHLEKLWLGPEIIEGVCFLA